MNNINYPEVDKRDSYKENYKEFRDKQSVKFFKEHNPIILNSNIVPDDGAKIFIGNHRHVNDQYPVILSQTEIIHWLSKSEYFQVLSTLDYYRNIRDKTNKTKIDALINAILNKVAAPKFKEMLEKTGSIPAERGTDRAKLALECANEFLKVGDSVGLFPEQTRNISDEPILKDNWKPGSVIMAKETGACIQPFVGNGIFNKEIPSITLFADAYNIGEQSIMSASNEQVDIMIEKYLELKALEKRLIQNRDLDPEIVLEEYHVLKKIK